MIARTGHIAVAAISSIPLKALPVVGITAIIGGTIYELSMLCAGLDDIELLYSEMDIEVDAPDDTYQQVSSGPHRPLPRRPPQGHCWARLLSEGRSRGLPCPDAASRLGPRGCTFNLVRHFLAATVPK